MPITTDKELPDNARSLWLKALSAVELRNYGYCISLIQAILKDSPGFLDGRKVLRKAEIANTKGKKSVFSGLSGGSKGSGLVKKDPLAAMEAAEKSLETDPYNAAANHLLRDAAKAAGFPEIASFAIETLVEANPKDTKLMHELGEHYTAIGDAERAVHIYSRIVDLNPADQVAIKRSKDAAANATMKSGGWETAQSYKDLIRNKDETRSLEEKSRTFKDVDMINNQLGELYPQYEGQPENVELVRRIAQLHDQRQQQTEKVEDLAEAVQWFAYLNDLLKAGDPNIQRKLSDLQFRQLDQSIKALEDWFAAGGDQHEEAEQYRAQLADLKRQKAEGQIAEAKRRVERNPTDLVLRYELGEKYMQAEMYTEAVPELQRARQNPATRLKAMNLLGQCFTEKGMFDMAVTALKGAATEMLAMDATKKDVLYKLGLLYQRMENKTEYMACMKEIYETDYGYKDVAQRVESSYGG